MSKKRFITTLNFFVGLIVLLSASDVAAESDAPKRTAEKGYIAPFKIFDNVYYVGDKWVASYLLTGEQGHILIDTLEYPYTKWIKGNLQQLGFAINDVKTIIITHGHSDHVGGIGWLQRQTNSVTHMSAQALALTQNTFSRQKNVPGLLSSQVQLLVDGQKIPFANKSLTIYTTPGHTRGAISIAVPIQVKSQQFKGLIFGGVGTNFDSIELANQYLASVQKLSTLHAKAPFAINLANHPHRAKLFARIQQRTQFHDPMIDPVEFSRFLRQLKTAGELRLRELTYKPSVNNKSK